jgi:Cysteine-rich secretory protein family
MNEIEVKTERQNFQIATGGESGQPKAANMRELTWDEDLAVVAQHWADQCKFEHDTPEARLIF